MFPTRPQFPEDRSSAAKKLYPEARIKLCIKNWQPPYEMWPLKYPTTPFFVTGLITANYISGRVLRLFKLRGPKATFVVRLPSMLPLPLLMLYHKSEQLPAVIDSFDGCPICYQMKAAATQVFCSVVHPLVLSLICSSHAALYVPRSYLSDWRGNIRLLWNDLKSKPSPYLTASLISFAAAVGFTELQQYVTLRVFEAVGQVTAPSKRQLKTKEDWD